VRGLKKPNNNIWAGGRGARGGPGGGPPPRKGDFQGVECYSLSTGGASGGRFPAQIEGDAGPKENRKKPKNK